MHQMRLGIGTATLLLTAAAGLAQPLGTVFTYQGQLKESGDPAAGTYDLRFRLFDAALGGIQIGATDCVDGVMPVDGLFTVEIDFGAVAFDGNSRWLEIAVRSDATPANCGGGAAYTVLTTRQPLTAVPYAMFALDGPGQAGYWTANGTGIYNTNTGNVGIGMTTPAARLDVASTASNAVSRIRATNSAQDTWVQFWSGHTAGSNDPAIIWSDATGGDDLRLGYGSPDGNTFGELMRITGGGRVGIGTASPGRVLHTVGDAVMFERAVNDAAVFLRNTANGTLTSAFGLKNTGASAGYSYLTDAVQVETLVMRDGKVGIGTATPGSARLDVVPALGQYGVRVVNDGQNTAIRADSTGGTAPTVYGTSNSTLASSVAVHGLMTAVTPGAGSAGVRGTISSTSSDDTYGVYGKHNGSGWGVYSEALGATGVGVQGTGWWGLYGVANSTTGYGGVFAGSGFLGSGQALLVLGESHLSTTGIGTTNPAAILHVTSNSDAEPGGGGIVVIGNTTGGNIAIDGNEIMARSNGATSTLYLNNDGGTVRVPVLEITGADLAEKFPTSDAHDAIQPGMVMEIDPANAGKLRIANGAYNRRVAGVVSGAGDIPVGAILGNLPGHEDAPAIALSGRVWVQCDASEGGIAPGDLLTTSDTPGCAMKATDYPRAQGAIIGKAMGSLKHGERGLVLVLVNLQ